MFPGEQLDGKDRNKTPWAEEGGCNWEGMCGVLVVFHFVTWVDVTQLLGTGLCCPNSYGEALHPHVLTGEAALREVMWGKWDHKATSPQSW